MTTCNIKDIDELDRYWASKYRRLENYRKKVDTGLIIKIAKLHARARVDYKFNELVRVIYPDVHLVIYAEMERLGIVHQGIIRHTKLEKG